MSFFLTDYAIETIDLVKKYPMSVTKTRQRRPWVHGGVSLRAVFDAYIRRGPFLTALDQVSLKVEKKEIFGLLGPNGAGKTTFIKILCTLILPDEGEAYVNGLEVQREPAKVVRNLQALFSGDAGLDWRLTARQSLDFYAMLYGLPKLEARQKINNLLNFAGLKGREDDPFQRYSSGMARKVRLCRALLLDVPILLFDEPTVGLDPASAVEFRNLLRDRLSREEGRTIFICTHNMWEAQELCDRIAIIDRGKIIACDTPDNIRRIVRPEIIYDFTFANTIFDDGRMKVLNEIEEIKGVNKVVPRISREGTLHGLTVHADVDLNLSNVISILSIYNLEIRSMGVAEPSLEDAFIAITNRKGVG